MAMMNAKSAMPRSTPSGNRISARRPPLNARVVEPSMSHATGEILPSVCMNGGVIWIGHQAPPKGASVRLKSKDRPLAWEGFWIRVPTAKDSPAVASGYATKSKTRESGPWRAWKNRMSSPPSGPVNTIKEGLAHLASWEKVPVFLAGRGAPCPDDREGAGSPTKLQIRSDQRTSPSGSVVRDGPRPPSAHPRARPTGAHGSPGGAAVLASRPLGGDTKNPQSRTDQIELPQQSGKRPAGR